jgi:hypothetical protein
MSSLTEVRLFFLFSSSRSLCEGDEADDLPSVPCTCVVIVYGILKMVDEDRERQGSIDSHDSVAQKRQGSSDSLSPPLLPSRYISVEQELTSVSSFLFLLDFLQHPQQNSPAISPSVPRSNFPRGFPDTNARSRISPITSLPPARTPRHRLLYLPPLLALRHHLNPSLPSPRVQRRHRAARARRGMACSGHRQLLAAERREAARSREVAMERKVELAAVDLEQGEEGSLARRPTLAGPSREGGGGHHLRLFKRVALYLFLGFGLEQNTVANLASLNYIPLLLLLLLYLLPPNCLLGFSPLPS